MNYSMKNVLEMSVKELKAELRRNSISYHNIIEKSELCALVETTRTNIDVFIKRCVDEFVKNKMVDSCLVSSLVLHELLSRYGIEHEIKRGFMYNRIYRQASLHFWIHSNGIDYDLSRRMHNELFYRYKNGFLNLDDIEKKMFAERFHNYHEKNDYELVLSVHQNVEIDQANYVELSHGYNSYIQDPLEFWSTVPIYLKEIRDNILK